MNSKTVGEKTEALVLAALVHVFPVVLLPFGDNQRYDFVVQEEDDSFLRIQSKTGRLRNGAIRFNACSSATQRGGDRKSRSYHGQVDYFAVAGSELEGVFLVPIADVGVSETSIRVDPPRKADPSIKWAKEYLIYGSL